MGDDSASEGGDGGHGHDHDYVDDHEHDHDYVDDHEHDHDYEFETTVQVRFRDIDAFGHVNNAVYATYCEVARTAYLREVLDEDLSTPGLVVAHLSVDFRAAVDDVGEVTVALGVTDVGRTSFTLGYDVVADGDLVATAETVQVTVDPESQSPRPVPEAWREAFPSSVEGA